MHLIAASVALEDVHEEAGPLEYFPGSHLGRGRGKGAIRQWRGTLYSLWIEGREAARISALVAAGLRRNYTLANRV